ncbi:MAG: cation diffusion facilitator family transporter [Acidobacteriia bacterium]|nr:cation diffusion facilitator family transporter [Terriglobia bacterium]
MSLLHRHQGNVGFRLLLTILLNLVIFVAELIFGIVANSLALITDAFHNLTDFSSAVISLTAHRISQREADSRRTFGYQRVEILAAVLNVAVLFAVAGVIFIKAFHRLQSPAPVRGGLMFGVALVALMANVAAAMLLRESAKENLNVRSTFVHALSDALSSLGAMIAGVFVMVKGWEITDSLASLLIGVFIVWGGWGILKEATNILLNAAPRWIKVDDIKARLEQLPEVEGVHHIHVWSSSSASVAFSAHILVKNQTLEEVDRLSHTIREILVHEFQVDHPTLQFETRQFEAVALFCNEIPDRPNETPGRTSLSSRETMK